MDNSQIKSFPKSYLSETDLFKFCIMHPKYTSHIMGIKEVKDDPYQ